MSETESTFQELGQLMRENENNLGVLATAIEQDGIHGWDQYGRFKLFPTGGPECKEALEAIAKQFSWRVDSSYPAELSPLDSAEGFCVYTRYGWPKEKLLDFQKNSTSSENVPLPIRRPSAVARTENSNLAIIGSLLACVNSKINLKRTKLYHSEAELIEEMQADYGHLAGLSENNIRQVFKAAKDFVDVSVYRRRG